jgi:hypothetical protein
LGRVFHGSNFYDAPAALASDDLSLPTGAQRSRGIPRRNRVIKATGSLDFARDDGELFLLENFDRFPRFVGRRLFVFERALQIHLGQQIVGIEFQET